MFVALVFMPSPYKYLIGYLIIAYSAGKRIVFFKISPFWGKIPHFSGGAAVLPKFARPVLNKKHPQRGCAESDCHRQDSTASLWGCGPIGKDQPAFSSVSMYVLVSPIHFWTLSNQAIISSYFSSEISASPCRISVYWLSRSLIC